MNPVVLKNFGIEIEFQNLPIREVYTFGRDLGWKVIEDGSCRSYHVKDVSSKYILEGYISDYAKVTFGGELISPILNINSNNYRKDIYQILMYLYNNGEGISNTTSIHIHVTFPPVLPVAAYKAAFAIGLHFEDLFYRISCGEAGIHRGSIQHNYRYCRPLLFPHCVKDEDDNYRHIFDITKIIKYAKTYEDIRCACGNYSSSTHYHPARYMWLNPISIFRTGTLEFRIFNSTKNPRLIYAWIDLVMSFLKATLTNIDNYDLEVRPLGSKKGTIEELVDFFHLKNETAYQLEAFLAKPQKGVKYEMASHTLHNMSFNSLRKNLLPDIVTSRILTIQDDTVMENTSFIKGTVRR